MNKYRRIIFKILGIIFGILLIVYIALYTYISVNKKSLIKQVTTEIGKRINGKVSIEDIELSFFRHFPKISVLLNNVSITDTLFAQHKHPVFQARRIFANLSIWKLIKKQAPLNGLTIEKGSFYLFTDNNGYTNTYLFTPKKDSAGATTGSSGKNELKSILLKEVSIIIDDRKKEKLHNFFVNSLAINLGDKDEVFLFDTRADITIHGMAFNLPRGTFLKEKKFTGRFELSYNKLSNRLKFDSININLAGEPFNLSGSFDLKGDAPQFSLRAHVQNILYNEGKSLLTERIAKSLSIADADKPLNINASLSGPLKGGEPLISADFTVKGTRLTTPFLNFDNASFTGYYTNEVVKGSPRNDPNSIINISNFSADWQGLPFTSANIQVLNLQKPVLTCDLAAGFPLTKLNKLVASNALQLQAGQGTVNITYKGPIEKNNNTNSFLNGIISFKDGTLLYTPRNVEMKEVSGQLIFKNSDIFIKDFQSVVLDNKIIMQGEAKNLLTLINTEPGKASIDWNINCPSLNLNAFTFLLKPAEKITPAKSKSKTPGVASKIDEVLEKASLHVKLLASRLYYKKFNGENVNADISLLEDRYIINNVSMAHAGGNINMNGSLVRQKANNLQASVHTTMNNVDVSKVLSAFDNFGQNAIMAQNLAGKLTANIGASLGLDESANVLPSSVKSVVSFSLKNGALVNYEPIKKLQFFLFENRDFSNIRFAELKDTLEIANSDVKINRMEIQSTLLSFFIEGIYSMKGNSDISIQVPLNNLKKRDADYKPENIGTAKKAGRSIYVRGRTGSDGNISFKLDLFNKYKKEKNRRQ